MHTHCEIVMPPTPDIHTAITTIMAPFDENLSDDDLAARIRWWDYWTIGGRWSGAKLEASLDQTQLAAFHEELKARKITVSGIQSGKQELSPASQIPAVDALWQEFFPHDGGFHCPFFAHSGQGDDNALIPGDVMAYRKVPASLSCGRIIVADVDYKAAFMLQTEQWNGVNWEESTWDGTFGAMQARLNQYASHRTWFTAPQPDWLVVTVDTHS